MYNMTWMICIVLISLEFFSRGSLLSSRLNEFLYLLMKISDVFFLRQSLVQNGICIQLVVKLQMPIFPASIYLKHNVKVLSQNYSGL